MIERYKTKKNRTSSARYASSFACTLFLSTSLLSTALSADDTEVFFGQLDGGSNPYPNVMFVLDTSDSMFRHDSGYEGTRIARLREAFHNMIDSVDNLNIGMMRLNGPGVGGTVIAPIRPIDAPICEDLSCSEISTEVGISSSASDAAESSGAMTNEISEPTLSLGSASDAIGLRFSNTAIPQGATITSAELVFNATQNSSAATNLQISAVVSDDMAEFESTTNTISSMPTGASISWNGVEAWQTDGSYTSPSIASLVQETVNRTDYCGGNALGFVITGNGERIAKSFDHADDGSSPILRVSYDVTSIPDDGGCISREVSSYIERHTASAYQLQSGGSAVRTTASLPIPYTSDNNAADVGLHFKGLDIPQGATILSARVNLVVDTAHSGNMEVDITAEDTATPDRYGNLTNRTTLGSSVTWLETTDPAINTKVQTADLSVLVQQLVDKEDWAIESAVSFIFKGNTSSPGFREFKSVANSNALQVDKTTVPTLDVKYKIFASANDQNIALTARDELKQLVDEMDLTLATPLVGSQYEAANYFLGRDVDMGLARGNQQGQNRVSHPDSYTGGTLLRGPECHDGNLSSLEACGSEEITGDATYISPIENSCQANHIVMLSDGAAYGNPPASKVSSLTGLSCAGRSRSEELCGVELAQWLSETDHDTSLAGEQTIQTHSIGFNISHDYLQDVAAAGGGQYYDASSADELTDVFQNIVSNISPVDTSFVSPATSISQFNRLEHDSELFFALFEPNENIRWDGNLKRFELSTDESGGVSILDKNGDNAVDSTTGFFSASSQSFWSDAVDGGSINEGGAAEQLDTLSDERKVFTDAGVNTLPTDGLVLNDPDRSLHEDNDGITQTDLGINQRFNRNWKRIAYRSKLLAWIRGTDIRDEDGDGLTTDRRAYIGDPMHSEPVVVNYNTDSGWERSILMSTNEGFLHSIDGGTGNENWAFMPKELLVNIEHNYNNAASRNRTYGLDGPMSVWIDDANGNTAIDSGEDAYLFVGMRRGGNNYYAFNISDKDNPRLAWVIRGGISTGFEELGQSWSEMTPATVMINGTAKHVLIFGAGYSTVQDDQDSAQGFDTEGRGLYMVDAKTGEKLWSGLPSTATGSGINQVFADMQYSMPGNLRVLDVDLDGLADQFYASDTGGRVWRFDIEKYHQSGNLVDGGIMADLGRRGASNTPNSERRFYYEPDVALNSEDGERYLSIAIGSGWRSHPLDDVVEDRIYVIRSSAVLSKPEGYGLEVETGGTSYWRPIEESDLTDVTTDLNPTSVEFGWMLRLTTEGEKVLAKALTVNSQLLVTTYTPEANAEVCSAAVGSSAIYVMNIANGAPTIDLNDDGTLTVEDRKRSTRYKGIAPAPSALITSEGGVITVGPSQPLPEFDFGDLIRKMYWRDRGKNASELSFNEDP